MLPPEDTKSGRPGRRVPWPFLTLVVVVLGIWAVSQLLPPDDADEAELAYSEVKRLVQDAPESIERLEFRPDDRTIGVLFADGTNAESAYPSELSAAELERTLDEQGVEYTAEPGGGSPWWSFFVYLVPFALFFGFWIFLMRGMNGRTGDREQAGEWWRRGG